MVEDVRLALQGQRRVEVLGRPAMLPEAEEILDRAAQMSESSLR
jgi:hypothetical protein